MSLTKEQTTNRKTALDRGQTDCISLTRDTDLQSSTHMQKFKVNGEWARKIDWKQKDGR